MPRRNLLWLFLGLTGGAALMLWMANQTGGSGDPPPYDCLLDATHAGCRNSGDRPLGALIILTGTVVAWSIGAIIIGLIWLVHRPRSQPCPTCGSEVKPGQDVCGTCRRDFRVKRPVAAGGVTAGPVSYAWTPREKLLVPLGWAALAVMWLLSTVWPR